MEHTVTMIPDALATFLDIPTLPQRDQHMAEQFLVYGTNISALSRIFTVDITLQGTVVS